MATVRMSQQLRDRIQNLAMEDYDRTVQSTDKRRIEIDEIIAGNWADCPYIRDFKALQTTLDTVSAGMNTRAFQFVNDKRNASAYFDKIDVYIGPNTSYSFGLTNIGEFRGIGHDLIRFKTLKLVPEDFGEPHAARLRELITTHKEGLAKAHEKRRNFFKGVRDLLSQCNTVKQLLTAWPAAEKLLPTDVIHKMHQKVERKFDADAAKARANFDPTEANTTMLTAALLGDVA